MRRPATLTRAGLALALGASLGAACSDEDSFQTGVVVRPSGLAYVEWKNDPAAPLEARGDLFVADPEAGGVNVAQLSNFLVPLDSGATAVAGRVVFVRSPSLFFPLVLPAPTYATQVATASAAATRLYALSPVDARLHVYAIGEAPYDASITQSNPYASLGEVVLGAGVADPRGLAAGVLERGLVVDVEVLRDDLILLAVDDLGSGAARLLSVRVTSGPGAPPTAEVVGSAAVAAAPRRIAVRSAAPRGVWLSSAATSSVTFVPILDADRTLGPPVLVGVGGPSSAVVDAGDSGAVALRIDRASMVLLDADGAGAWARADRPTFSPYTTGAEGRGEISTREIAVAGAAGRLPSLPAPSGSRAGNDLVTAADRGADGLANVVYVAYSDGGGVILVGKPLRWPSELIRPLAYTRGDEAGVRFEACPAVTPAVCEAITDDADVTPFACTGAVVRQRGPGITVRYRGAFAVAPSATVVATASTAARVAEVSLGDGASGFGAARAGDRVFLALPAQATCTSTPTMPLAGEAAILEVLADRLRIVLDRGPLADAVAGCPANVLAARAEAFAAGPEFVVERGAERERLTATATAGRYAGASTRGVEAAFSVVDTATCTVATVPLRSCTVDADCPGAACVFSDTNLCGGRCAATCAAGALGCWRSIPERRCPMGALSVASDASSGNELDAGFSSSTNAMSVPEDVVFSRLRRGWIISFPGARRMGDLRLFHTGGLRVDELK